MSNTERNALSEQVGYLALAVAQLSLIVIELGPRVGHPAPPELLTSALAVRSYGQALIRS